MANLTIAVDEDVLRRARVRAVEQGTSVNAYLREQLERYADDTAADRAAAELLRLSEEHPGSSGSGGRSWTREDLYAERLDRRA